LGLFFLAVFSRLLTAVRSSAEKAWAQSIALRRAASLRVPSLDGSQAAGLNTKLSFSSTTTLATLAPETPHWHQAPPFIPAIDIPSSLLFMLEAFVGYMLMLAVMTYNVWWFIAVLLGLGAGQLAFGRYSKGHVGHGIHP